MEADFVILADSAQVADGKISMLGGGWDRLNVRAFPTTHPMGIAMGILVPWEQTNEKHRFRVVLRNEDSQTELMAAEGDFEQGRPPSNQLSKGGTQRFLFAMNFALRLDEPFEGVVDLLIDGTSVKRVPFSVLGPAPDRPLS